jgi:hypothetical protein
MSESKFSNTKFQYICKDVKISMPDNIEVSCEKLIINAIYENKEEENKKNKLKMKSKTFGQRGTNRGQYGVPSP